jgi:hypothetical protein
MKDNDTLASKNENAYSNTIILKQAIQYKIANAPNPNITANIVYTATKETS